VKGIIRRKLRLLVATIPTRIRGCSIDFIVRIESQLVNSAEDYLRTSCFDLDVLNFSGRLLHLLKRRHRLRFTAGGGLRGRFGIREALVTNWFSRIERLRRICRFIPRQAWLKDTVAMSRRQNAFKRARSLKMNFCITRRAQTEIGRASSTRCQSLSTKTDQLYVE